MENPTLQTPVTADVSDAEIATATTVLQTLFDERDTVVFRPIETWTEGGRKYSRVNYGLTRWRPLQPGLLYVTLKQLLEAAGPNRLNLFFGVCPRFGNKGRFDLAWQIRTVRCLWADIDHISVNEAQQRITEAGLPPPSIVVNSGNGVHCYWLLDEPYLIDDAGDPPPVETEWRISTWCEAATYMKASLYSRMKSRLIDTTTWRFWANHLPRVELRYIRKSKQKCRALAAQ
jgi:hypothetical protein